MTRDECLKRYSTKHGYDAAIMSRAYDSAGKSGEVADAWNEVDAAFKTLRAKINVALTLDKHYMLAEIARSIVEGDQT